MLSRQLQDETYIYAPNNNEYTEEQFYETVPETSVKVNDQIYSYSQLYLTLACSL